MRILLTNDDGIFAPGLAAMYKQLKKFADITVIAPAEVKSGAGHSITIHHPLICDKVKIPHRFAGYQIHGSPADCVKIGLMQLCEEPPDLVVSGMNDGANVGINVYYSGTVAAAMESAFFRVPAVAVSLAREDEPAKMDFKAGAGYACEVIKKLLPLSGGEVVNINIPLLSQGRPKGVKPVAQSTHGFDETYKPQKTADGQTVYQLNGGAHRPHDGPTDTTALMDGFITITALHFDMTDHKKTGKLEQMEF